MDNLLFDKQSSSYSRLNCSSSLLETFSKKVGRQLWQVNALLVVDAILAAAIVGIGAYGQRFRHHPLTRFIFLGATTLFLPIISYVVSTTSASFNSYFVPPYPTQQWIIDALAATCYFDPFHLVLVITWAFLVQLAAINTSVTVAADDREAGRNIGPPFELLVQGVWTLYLGVSATLENPVTSDDRPTFLLQCAPFAFVGAKMLLKCYAFKMARRSFALGRNPRLISGYMQQLQRQEASHQHSEAPTPHLPLPPPLLVMGEEGRKVEKQPHGYVFKDNSRTTTTLSSLITVDRIWQLDNMHPMSSPQLKDLCLSFALFKLLRCRFERYELYNISSVATLNFFWSFLLEDGEHTARVFGVVADEISFLHDYYYTSLPISYSKGCWLPILSACISLLSIGYCVLIALRDTLDRGPLVWELPDTYGYQIACNVWCITNKSISDTTGKKIFGSLYFDLVPVYLLFLLVVMSEVRDISSYICSKWTKVAIICSYVGRPSCHPRMLRWARLLLRCKCNKVMKHWDDKIGQCSVLVLHRRTTTLFDLFSRLRLPSQKTKVKLSTAVKVCIVDALRNSNSNGRRLNNCTSSLRRACSNSKGTSDTILAWQIATWILEVRYPPRQYEINGEHGRTPSISDYRIAAIHLSRYCVYLVISYPELLPDDDAWSKRLYKAVNKDATRVLANHHENLVGSTTPEAKYQELVAALDQESEHEVLKNGARLGRELAEMIEGEETTWKLLGGFWSEMILYVAPSNNLKGHSEAIARGGEFITLLWALLFHAGIVNRPGEAGGTTGVD